MCEPFNSLTQYPDSDDQGRPTQGPIEADLARQDREQGVKTGFWNWLKRISGFLHLTRLGAGHSEAIRHLGRMSDMLIPEETRYECLWWDRVVRLDGPYCGKRGTYGLALAACETYARAVSIGSLTALRRFLEVSMRKTNSPGMYVDAFLKNMLNVQGRDELWKKNGKILRNLADARNRSQEALECAIKVMLGFTRKRAYLNPAWADDGSLWLPTRGIEQ